MPICCRHDEGGGHWLHLEQPAQVAQAIASLVSTLSNGADWRKAFDDKSAQSFETIFADDIEIQVTTTFGPVKGRQNVKIVMEQASKIHESLEFTDRASAGDTEYLQWRATAFGGKQLAGVTIIKRYAANAIQQVAIHHRPLAEALLFSAALGQRLKGVMDTAIWIEFDELPTRVRG